MSVPKLIFVVNSKAGEWEATATVLELVEANPFGEFQWLTDDLQSAPEARPYERPALQKCLQRPRWDFLLHRDDDPAMSLWLTRRPHGITIQLTVEAASLTEEWDRFVRYSESWIERLPCVTSGRTYDANADIAGLYRELELDQPPACFSASLQWRHYLGPEYYELFLRSDDLLAAPAWHIETREGGLVVMTCFPQPFGWNGDEARERLTRLTEYLNDKDVFSIDG